MTQRNTLEHRTSTAVEHQEEKTTDLDQTKYPGARDEASHQKANNYVVQFKDELATINDKAASAFDHREDLSDYKADERREFVTAYVQAFNNVEFNENHRDKYLAARDICDTVFKPITETVELAEFRTQQNIDQDTIKAMEEAGVKHIEKKINPDGTGSENYKFHVQDMETARKIVEASDGKIFISTAGLEDYKTQFTNSLYLSSQDQEFSAEYMTKSLNDAIAYSNGEQRVADNVTWNNTSQEQHDAQAQALLETVGVETEHAKKRAESTSYESLENKPDHQKQLVLDGMAIEGWSNTRSYIDELHQTNHPDAAGALQVYETIKDLTAQGLMSSLDHQNQDTYESVLAKIPGRDLELFHSMKANQGFIRAEGYEKHPLPEDFGTILEARNYIDEVKDKLQELVEGKAEIPAINQQLLETLVRNYEARLQFTENMTGQNQNEAGLKEDLAAMHDYAKGIDYLMRPKDITGAAQTELTTDEGVGFGPSIGPYSDLFEEELERFRASGRPDLYLNEHTTEVEAALAYGGTVTIYESAEDDLPTNHELIQLWGRWQQENSQISEPSEHFNKDIVMDHDVTFPEIYLRHRQEREAVENGQMEEDEMTFRSIIDPETYPEDGTNTQTQSNAEHFTYETYLKNETFKNSPNEPASENPAEHIIVERMTTGEAMNEFAGVVDQLMDPEDVANEGQVDQTADADASYENTQQLPQNQEGAAHSQPEGTSDGENGSDSGADSGGSEN